MLVVVDGVFSMEGDLAPLQEITELCERYGARLMVDEAHGAGVLGARGAGASELLGVTDKVDVRIGTFSKSLASCGGFVVGPHEVIEYLRFYSRAFLFTASAVPAAVGAALAALRVLRSEDGPRPARAGARERLAAARRARGARFRGQPRAAAAARRARAGARPRGPLRRVRAAQDRDPDHLGAGGRRLEGGAAVAGPLRPGVFVNTALHPAVPPGGALLRTSVMATHDEATLERALGIFERVKREFEAEHGPLPSARPA